MSHDNESGHALTWNSPLLAAWVKYNTPSLLTGEGRGEGEIESKIPRPLGRGGSFYTSNEL